MKVRKTMKGKQQLRLYLPSGYGYIGPVIIQDEDVVTIKRSGGHINVNVNGETTLSSALTMNLAMVVGDEPGN